jgi:hypothetical protein
MADFMRAEPNSAIRCCVSFDLGVLHYRMGDFAAVAALFRCLAAAVPGSRGRAWSTVQGCAATPVITTGR